MCVGDVGIKTGFGIVVGEKVDVWEDPAEDVYKEDDAFCWGAILGLSDVGF